MDADHRNLFFGDVHVRGTYPGYMLRHFRDRGIELDITEEDRRILTHTVDFVSLSYYMSVSQSTDPEEKAKIGGNVISGVPNPRLEASE
jgi:6-phospho-beta-glucosidase